MENHLVNSVTVTAISAVLLFCAGCQRQPNATLRPSSQGTSRAPTSPLAKREPIFFLKDNATLSPGAIAKLRTWVASWGLGGKWTLAYPSGPGLTYDLMEKRLLAIREELRKLGQLKVETTLIASGPVGQYDVIYVVKEPY